jgi:2'-hydroxyisoflavone reductase
MRLLILGGTVFLGRHLVEVALRRGHEVTMFNRGIHGADLFPDVERLKGDRKEDLSALAGREWDAVIDTCGYFPRIVRNSARALAGSVGHYTFISSISVFSDFSKPGINEETPVATIEDETMEEITGESYGPLKALCEKAVEEEFPGRTLVVRPGLIVGPNDPTDRFTYWPHRVAEGGKVLAPGEPETPIQIIDVRDLAEWTIDLVEKKQTGIYNATGPVPELTMGTMLEECRRVSGSDAEFVWVDAAFLEKEGIVMWSDLPAWVPDTDETRGFSRVDVSKAVASGLTFRPIAETIADTLAWEKTLPADRELRAGLTRERETEALEKWEAEKAEVGEEK